MFSFIIEVFEMYYQKKLLSIANNRIETYTAIRFQGSNAQKVKKEDIEVADSSWYKVKSQTTPGECYSVNTHVGICTCTKGADGSSCLHQAAVVFLYGEYGLNFTTTLSSAARQKLAQISLGDGIISDMGFYSSLHQESLDEKYKSVTNEQVIKSSLDTVDGDNQGDFIHADVHNLHEEEATNTVSEDSMEETCKMIMWQRT